MSNFWAKLPQPFLVLAPMEDVTDYVFREIVADLPRPDVFFTEFTSSDGLFSKGREATIDKLKFSQKQGPVVAQIWGTNPENMYKSAKLVRELGFDGVDINMGCPDKAVMKKGAGAAHCINKELSREIIMAVKEGAQDISVSVKTRLGYKSVDTEWIPFLLHQNIDALTVHGRTAAQASTGNADWESIGSVVRLAQQIAPQTTIIGNGDIKTYSQAKNMNEKYKVHGIMIGRGIFSNPWVFEKSEGIHKKPREEYIALMMKHMELYVETWGKTKNFEVMKKFFKMYINNFPGASILRQELMYCKNKEQVTACVTKAIGQPDPVQISGGVYSEFDILPHD